ncbi:MAG: hypothetical protein GX442_22870, partial [Candidatus Riflebacteria bacterium]|nr:hypothetical protein [Candidatus Riflebacteria bacterium]
MKIFRLIAPWGIAGMLALATLTSGPVLAQEADEFSMPAEGGAAPAEAGGAAAAPAADAGATPADPGESPAGDVSAPAEAGGGGDDAS